MLVARAGGPVEVIDTMATSGFPVGLVEDIGDFLSHLDVQLAAGDVAALYSGNGIPEAENLSREQYGMERLCRVFEEHQAEEPESIKQAILDDLRQFIGTREVLDDITLVVLKQR